MVSWRDVPLLTGFGFERPREVAADSPEGIGYLREYRRTGTIKDVLLCSRKRYDLASEGEDLSMEGPSEEIDWTDFPE